MTAPTDWRSHDLGWYKAFEQPDVSISWPRRAFAIPHNNHGFDLLDHGTLDIGVLWPAPNPDERQVWKSGWDSNVGWYFISNGMVGWANTEREALYEWWLSS